jgi:hypothetical protein
VLERVRRDYPSRRDARITEDDLEDFYEVRQVYINRLKLEGWDDNGQEVPLSLWDVQRVREVHNYALCSKQACSRMLGASLDGELRHAYELVTERLREENHAEVSWEQAVQVFKMLVGKDLCDLEHDAMIKIIRGEIKQGKEETMFNYSVKFRHNVFAAPAILVIFVCNKFISGM